MRPMNFSRFAVTTLATLVWSGVALWSTHPAVHAQNINAARQNRKGNLEEIYFARSVRESRIKPTEFCAEARTGFANSVYEDRYTFRSISGSSSDGRMVDGNVRTIGTGHACFGETGDSKRLNFYGEIRLGRNEFKGIGVCLAMKADFPERGLTANHCFLDISSIPRPYVGGLLTTNTMVSLQTLGLETEPRGYTQSSIATIRLWKRQPER